MLFTALGQFRPSGDLWTRLQRNFARLEETKYYPQNVYQREKEAEGWPGDTEGRTLLAWVLLAQATGRAPRYLEEMLELWPEEINELGYIGKIYSDGISEQQLSSHGWVLQALAELERWVPDGGARNLATPIIDNLFLPTVDAYANYPVNPAEREADGEFSGTHAKQVGQWLLSTDVGCFAIGMTGLIDAADAFSLQSRLKPLIEAMIETFLRIDLKAIKAQTHATLTALRGLIRWSRMTGNEDLWAEVEKRYRLYTDLAWTETYANFNWFDRPQWTEPCALVDSLIVAMELWRHTRKSAYLEHAQLIWFNALGHGQRANGGFGCDNCPGADGETGLFFKTQESHWCCTMRGGEGLARMCEYQAVRDGETWLLPFGLPGDFTDGEVSLRIQSDYPLGAEWTFHNRGNKRVALQLFVPSWVEGIDAKDGWLSLDLEPGTSQTVQGKLKSGEREVLPATTSYNPKTQGNAVRYAGPLLLAQYGDDWKPIYEDYLRGDMTEEHSVKRFILATPGN